MPNRRRAAPRPAQAVLPLSSWPSARNSRLCSLLSPQMLLAAAQAGDSAGPALTTDVTTSQLQSLPLSGRNWQDFVLDTPPAASYASGDGSSATGEHPAAVTVDGASIRLAFGGAGAGSMRGHGASLIGPGAGESAIRQVQAVASDADAAGSRAAGADAPMWKPSAAPIACTGRALSSAARSILGRAESLHPVGAADRTRHAHHRPGLHARSLTRPATAKRPGASAWAGASAATGSSGSPPSTATSATIPACRRSGIRTTFLRSPRTTRCRC